MGTSHICQREINYCLTAGRTWKGDADVIVASAQLRICAALARYRAEG